jgi:hypothetical protein
MTDPKKIKAVDHRLPDPFQDISINVCPVSVFGRDDTIGHSVGIMNDYTGQGVRKSLEYAEAEAKAVLKAIRAYRRKNPEAGA